MKREKKGKEKKMGILKEREDILAQTTTTTREERKVKARLQNQATSNRNR